jgi:hypothetical protein
MDSKNDRTLASTDATRSQHRIAPMTANYFVLALVALLFAVPYFIFPAGWFGDDGNVLAFAQRNVDGAWSRIFLYEDGQMGRYRPLMQLLATSSFRHFGLDTVFIRSLSYCAFLTTIVALHALLRRVKPTGAAALFGTIYFAAIPIKTQALARPGRPEIFVTTFCLLSVLCLQKVWGARDTKFGPLRRTAWLTLSMLGAATSALWAELGTSTFLVLIVWVLAPLVLSRDANERGNRPILLALGQRALLPLSGLALYLLWYARIGAPAIPKVQAGTRYDLQVGLATVRNVLHAVTGISSPIATPTIYRISSYWASAADWVLLTAGFVSIGTLIVVAVRAIRQHPRDVGLLTIFWGSSLVSLFPFVFVGHVSEVYLLQSAAFFSGGVGVVAATAYEQISRRSKRLLTLAATSLLFVMFYSSADAFTLLRHNATLFSTLYNDLVERRRTLGNEYVVLVPPCTPARSFSQYYLPLHRILTYRDHSLPRIRWLPDCRATSMPEGNQYRMYRVDALGRTTADTLERLAPKPPRVLLP